jgi:hypothetical protein
LRTDIAELSDETKDYIVLLVNWSLANLVPKFVDSEALNLGAM